MPRLPPVANPPEQEQGPGWNPQSLYDLHSYYTYHAHTLFNVIGNCLILQMSKHAKPHPHAAAASVRLGRLTCVPWGLFCIAVMPFGFC